MYEFDPYDFNIENYRKIAGDNYPEKCVERYLTRHTRPDPNHSESLLFYCPVEEHLDVTILLLGPGMKIDLLFLKIDTSYSNLNHCSFSLPITQSPGMILYAINRNGWLAFIGIDNRNKPEYALYAVYGNFICNTGLNVQRYRHR